MLTPEDLEQIRAILAAAVQQLTASQERAVEANAANLSDLRGELTSRFDAADRRADRMAESLRAVELRLSSMTRWADTADRDTAAN